MLNSALEAAGHHLLVLPDAPCELSGPVKAWRQPVTIWTYSPERPNRNPMFLEKRVYQGSSGKVYPLPFIDRIATEAAKKEWKAIHIENEYLRLMILPEIGGRIHVGYDKINGYDFFYRQNVIKPALVGLAGPWISGGVEFNWPQHHRPATFMPVDTEIEEESDGSITVWCSDHDPMLRMKGMHGIRLSPGRSLVELRGRLYNRTPFTQTFLWWANVAVRVHEKYQSFFPTDVRYVADHAKRAITTFPLSDRPYYGIDYATRAVQGVPPHEAPPSFPPDGSYPPNDLSWYANIPVPTSYMVTDTKDDFFGGYDHNAQAGFVHVANHHIAPGKKQWTWGNHEFGYAWDRSLTNEDGPYIELMAGVYTDNQPDFSYLAPWETKTFSQYWYPIRGIGVPQAANTEAAIHVEHLGHACQIAVAVTRDLPEAVIEVKVDGKMYRTSKVSLEVKGAFRKEITFDSNSENFTVSVTLLSGGRRVLEYNPTVIVSATNPTVASEPPAPEDVKTNEELFLIGMHLEQYRHATREPQIYWKEALRRDPQDTRSLNAYGLWLLRSGQFVDAMASFKKAIHRLAALNPNPHDGEPFYNLGLTCRYLGLSRDAYDAFYKASWSAAWRAPAYFALAECDVSGGDWPRAAEHLQRSLKAESDNLNARSLLVYTLRRLGNYAEADRLLRETGQLDSLDIASKWEAGQRPIDSQQIIDLAIDLSRSGRSQEAIKVLSDSKNHDLGSAPIIYLLIADLQAGNRESDDHAYRQFSSALLDLCHPHRLEELLVLERTVERHPESAGAWYLLGNCLYDKRRHREAMKSWETAAHLEPSFPTVWRNLGISYFNVTDQVDQALVAFDRALEADPSDGRILYERDQLWKRVGKPPEKRLAELSNRIETLSQRDDLSIELVTLFNQLGDPEKALALLERRRFQPWEGGEGLVLGQYVRSCLLLGQASLEQGEQQAALAHFRNALQPPENLGEAKHLLANQSHIYFWIGAAYTALGDKFNATNWFNLAATHKSDFQQMSVRPISEMTFWTGLALTRLGREEEAEECFIQILTYGKDLDRSSPKVDYFATSLPAMLLFKDDLERRNHINAIFLQAQAVLGLGSVAEAQGLLVGLLHLDPNHAESHDLLAHMKMFDQKASA